MFTQQLALGADRMSTLRGTVPPELGGFAVHDFYKVHGRNTRDAVSPKPRISSTTLALSEEGGVEDKASIVPENALLAEPRPRIVGLDGNAGAAGGGDVKGEVCRGGGLGKLG